MNIGLLSWTVGNRMIVADRATFDRNGTEIAISIYLSFGQSQLSVWGFLIVWSKSGSTWFVLWKNSMVIILVGKALIYGVIRGLFKF